MALIWPFFETVLVGTALFLGFLFFRRNKKDPRYPPGPKPIPLLGNVLQLRNDPLKVFQNWAEKYGPIYSFQMGTQDAIVINDPKLVKELYSDINSIGRARNPVTYYFGAGNGIINADGHIWEAQRTFTVRKLREFGVLNSSNEGFLMEEAETLIKYFKRWVGKPISGKKLFDGPVINGLWRIVSGENTDWDSDGKSEILRRAESLTELANRASLVVFAPFLRHVAPNYFGWTSFTNAVDCLMELIRKSVAKHTQQFDPNNPLDFIDHYLVKMRKTTDSTSTFYEENGARNLEAVVADLFAAGSETSSNTLSFAMLYLILNQEAQQKAQNELDFVIGSSRQVSLSDKPALPYTEAMLLETFRLSSIAPLGLPHRILADTIFHGYFLPKNVAVFSNLYAIHHDPKIWGEDVNEFRPERFLSEDETRVIHHEAFMPFSVGRRACIGESFARESLFLFLASILHRFNIQSDPECPVLAVETVAGFAVEPKPFKFVLTLRN